MLKNKILHINCNYIGTTLHQAMIEKLEKLGYDNRVFVPTYNKNLAVLKVNSNVKVCECFKKWDRILFDYKQLKIYKAIANEYKIDNFNLIHAYTLFTDGNCARELSKKYNIPYVVAIRNTDVNDFFKLMPHLRNRGIKIMQDASAIFFLSESYKKQVFDKYVPNKYKEKLEKKVYIIPNGIDEFWFKNSINYKKIINTSKVIKLVYAGRIDKNKNIPTIQKAIKILIKKDYRVSLTVIGKIQDIKEFENIKKDINTKYIPEMSKEDLIKFYRKSDIFVMPSYTESFGLVYAEAMTQGLPVIYSKNQGFDRQFKEGLVGYHVLPYKAENVAEGILKIINSYDIIQKKIVNLAEVFDWSVICMKYKGIYDNIIKKEY